jgi:hypothetical protein
MSESYYSYGYRMQTFVLMRNSMCHLDTRSNETDGMFTTVAGARDYSRLAHNT